MEKQIFLFCILILISCSGTSDMANVEEISYLLNSEIEQDNKALIAIIENKDRRLKTDSVYEKFKFETQKYFDFLETLKDLSIQNKINPFFEKEALTASGEQYRRMSFEYNALVTKKYPEMENLVKDLLNLNDIYGSKKIYMPIIFIIISPECRKILLFSSLKNGRKKF